MEWINPKDRMPKDNREVLVYFEFYVYGKYNGWVRKYGIGSASFGNWKSIDGHIGWQRLNVLGWMPLPDPPKEG